MYNFTNILVHLVALFLVLFSLGPEGGYKTGEMTLKKFALLAGLGILATWSISVGEVYNLYRLFVWR